MLSRLCVKSNRLRFNRQSSLNRFRCPALSSLMAKYGHRYRYRYLIPLILFSFLSACSLQPTPSLTSGSADRQALVEECFTFYQQLHLTSQRLELNHAPVNSFDDFPYLRSNRFLASFAGELSEPEMSGWLVQLNQLAVEALVIEWQQMPEAQRLDFVDDTDKPRRALIQELQGCGVLLVTDLLQNPQQWSLVVEQSQVPDHYSILKRSLGLYPLIKPFFKQGVSGEIERLQSERKVYRDQVVGVAGREISYWANAIVDKPSDTRSTFELSQDILGIPQLTSVQRQDLLAQWRPQWLIEKTQALPQSFNRPGRVEWLTDNQQPIVDITDPVQYEFVGFGRWQGQTTLQLNYSVWFSERPAEGPRDLLAGQLDSVFWRVHLTLDGQLLAFDSIHGCGCWYQLYPASGFEVASVDAGAEPFLIGHIKSESRSAEPEGNFSTQSQTSIRLHIRARDHQLMAVSAGPDSSSRPANEKKKISVADFEELYGLPILSGGYRSLFDTEGLVPASVRAERWLFWPMGIASPGAMRAPGTHAIAFVGRRHFDAPDLLMQMGLMKK